MGAGAWHGASSRSERHFRGGETGDEVDGIEHDMGSIPEGVLESIHDLAAIIDREAFVRERDATVFPLPEGRTPDLAGLDCMAYRPIGTNTGSSP